MTSARLLFCGLAAAAAAQAGAAQAPSPQTDISSENCTSVTTGDETTTIFTDHVVILGNNIKITCDYLKAVSAKASTAAAGSQPQFRSLLAKGHVHIIQGDIEAICGRADVTPEKETMTLMEKPVVTDRARGTVATGEPIVLTGHGRDYQISGKNVHFTGLPSLQELNAPATAPSAK